MQALREAEEANLELSGAQRLSWAAFGRSRALESTATGTMLSARRSRFFASASRRARPLLRREERRRTTVVFSAQPSNPARTEPRLGEHCYRHNAQCSKKPLLRLRQPECPAAAETRRTKAHNSGIVCAALKPSKDAHFPLREKSGKAFDEDAVLHRSRRGQSGAVRSSAPVVGGFRQEPRFGEHCYRHNAQCAKKPLLRLR
ncbi:unnamed protein product [Coccothraustes coccothraustes]